MRFEAPSCDRSDTGKDRIATATIFSSLAEGRTAVFISLRFSMARKADRIFLFHEGRLAEQGTHSELMRLAGRDRLPLARSSLTIDASPKEH